MGTPRGRGECTNLGDAAGAAADLATVNAVCPGKRAERRPLRGGERACEGCQCGGERGAHRSGTHNRHGYIQGLGHAVLCGRAGYSR
jgi:hypothetical protein